MATVDLVTDAGSTIRMAHGTALVPALMVSAGGPWFERPYVCIPAATIEGAFKVLIDLPRWHAAFAESGGDRPAASKAVFVQASTRGRWKSHDGEAALLLAD